MDVDEFEVIKAERISVPLLISLSGTSGSGKTFSGLLLAGGIAGADGQVGMIDAENGRGSLYADDPDIMKAIPKGYLRTAISAPYSPQRYIKAIKAQEAAGVTVCLIDSTTHEWEGEGGCTDIAENNKLKGMPNWAMAKREHKRFLAYCLSSRMHIIFCLRARDKVKITPDNKVIPIGIQPIAEKNFVFEMLISLMFDEATHQYSCLKVPKMLTATFPGGKLITREHGLLIRQWSDGGRAEDPMESVQKRARSAAELGMEEYQALFSGLTKTEQKALASTTHAANKKIAEDFDKAAKLAAEAEESEAAELKRRGVIPEE
jgi:hypothetical protein